MIPIGTFQTIRSSTLCFHSTSILPIFRYKFTNILHTEFWLFNGRMVVEWWQNGGAELLTIGSFLMPFAHNSAWSN